MIPADAPKVLWKTYREILFRWQHDQHSRCDGRSSQPGLRPAGRSRGEMLAVFALDALADADQPRRSDGAWIVALYNPWGAVAAETYMASGSVLDEGCAIRDVIQSKLAVRSARVIHAWPSSSVASLKNNEIRVTVGPGGTLILEITGT